MKNRRWTSEGYAAAKWDELHGSPGAVKRYLSDAPPEGFVSYRCASCDGLVFDSEAQLGAHIGEAHR